MSPEMVPRDIVAMKELIFIPLTMMAFFQCRLNQSDKQRVRPVGPGFKLRVELAADIPWMIGQFNHLDDAIVRRSAADHHAAGGQRVTIVVVDFIAVPVALMDQAFLIDTICP